MGFRKALRDALKGRTQHDIELDYLNQSVSRADLERRQHEIDNGALRPRRFGF